MDLWYNLYVFDIKNIFKNAWDVQVAAVHTCLGILAYRLKD